MLPNAFKLDNNLNWIATKQTNKLTHLSRRLIGQLYQSPEPKKAEELKLLGPWYLALRMWGPTTKFVQMMILG